MSGVLRTYIVLFGADVRAYASGPVEAENMRAAATFAKERFDELWPTLTTEDIDYSYPRHPTLIDVTDAVTDEREGPSEDFSVTDEDRRESAAKDMLDALRQATDVLQAMTADIEETVEEPHLEARAAIERAQTAIAKATGGAA